MTSLLRMTSENVEPYLGGIHEIEVLSFPSPWSVNAFRQEARNPVSHLWVSFSDDALMGYICFWLFDGEIQLVNIAVHPKARCTGLGTYLLTEMIKTGTSNGIHDIWLEVRLSNRVARGVYERLGFREVGRRKKYYTDSKEDAIVMSLSLGERWTCQSASQ